MALVTASFSSGVTAKKPVATAFVGSGYTVTPNFEKNKYIYNLRVRERENRNAKFKAIYIIARGDKKVV